MLLIKREKDPYKNFWSFPGGGIELYETYQDATKREVKEETGYEVELISQNRPDYVSNRIFKDSLHYLILTSSAYILNNQSMESEDIFY